MNRGVAGTDASRWGQLGGSFGVRPGGPGGTWLALVAGRLGGTRLAAGGAPPGGIWSAPVAGERPLGPGAGGRTFAGAGAGGGVVAADTGSQAGARRGAEAGT